MAETTNNLATALAAAQGEMPKIPKNKKANYGMYADLDTIHEKVLPVLSKHGLAWATLPGEDEAGNDVLFYKLLHGPSGEVLEGRMRLRLTQDNMQQFGSAITYAKRYTISAVTGATTDEDDDGNASSGREADGKGMQKQALPKKEIKSSAITTEQMAQLLHVAKEKGYTDKTQAMEVVDAFAISIFDKKTEKLTIDEATKLYADLNKPQTTKNLLDLLLSDEPF